MAIPKAFFRKCWVKQVGPNCGSCCVASIVNYIRHKLEIRKHAAALKEGKEGAGLAGGRARLPQPAILYDNSLTVGLTVDGVKGLGSVTAKLAEWVARTQMGLCMVTQVKDRHLMNHWGSLNALMGGDSHRPMITPDASYFLEHPQRFLLRECSKGISGHFIVQTGEHEFWDPNSSGDANPQTLADHNEDYRRIHGFILSLRADACQIDVT